MNDTPSVIWHLQLNSNFIYKGFPRRIVSEQNFCFDDVIHCDKAPIEDINKYASSA